MKNRLIILEFAEGTRLQFMTAYPLPSLLRLEVKGQMICDLDREGLKVLTKSFYAYGKPSQ